MMTWVWTFISKVMDFIYYGLYLFFTKIVRVQNSWNPNISIAGVMAIAIVWPLLFIEDKFITQPKLLRGYDIGLVLLLSLDVVFYKIYTKRETKVLEKYDRYSVAIKVLICITSLVTVNLCWATSLL